MSYDTDVAIVGGGLSGSSTALHLARAGLKVQIFDSKRFPRDKVCGEGIMPNGVRLLTELGVMSHLNPSDFRTFRGIEYVIDGQARARGEFPVLEGGFSQGIGVRRLKLDAVLLEMARAHPNVTVHEQVRVEEVLVEGGMTAGLRTQEGVVRARLVVGADGRGSLVRRQLGLDATPPPRQRYGIRAHLHFQDPARVGDFVEVYRNRFGELYTTPVSPHELLVALLIEKTDMDRFGGKLEAAYRDYLRAFPYLEERFAGSELCSEVMACGPLACSSTRPYAGGALLVGDSAGFLDAITGEGMSLALECARAAAEVAVAALANSGVATEDALAAYGTRRKSVIRLYILLTTAILEITKHPRLAALLVRRLNRTPSLFKLLLGINCGHFRLREVPMLDVGRFVLGV